MQIKGKFLLVLLAFVAMQGSVLAKDFLREKTEKEMFVLQELKKADKHFAASYQKEFGAKGYSVVFSHGRRQIPFRKISPVICSYM